MTAGANTDPQVELRALLPTQLMWVAIALPLLISDVPIAVIGGADWSDALRGLAALYVPFLCIPAALIVFYRRPGPWLVAGIARRGLRVCFHVVATAVISVALALILFPIYRRLDPAPLSISRWTLACVVNGWAMTLPTLWLVQLIRDRERKQRAVLEAKLDALHARVNPHFLFNSLNTIASLIADRPGLAEDVVERLSSVLRYTLDTKHRQLVPLSKEIAFARQLLSVYRARFEDALDYSIELDEELLDIAVPSLILQPIIENAISHGLATSGRGTIRIAGRESDEKLVLEVIDDGVGPRASSYRGTGSGLSDLRKRLTLLFGESATVALEPAEPGTCTRISLPARRDASVGECVS